MINKWTARDLVKCAPRRKLGRSFPSWSFCSFSLVIVILFDIRERQTEIEKYGKGEQTEGRRWNPGCVWKQFEKALHSCWSGGPLIYGYMEHFQGLQMSQYRK